MSDVIVGWSVHSGPVSSGAFYNLEQQCEAFEAAQRWGCAITALIAHPDAPETTPRDDSKHINDISWMCDCQPWNQDEGITVVRADVYDALAAELAATKGEWDKCAALGRALLAKAVKLQAELAALKRMGEPEQRATDPHPLREVDSLADQLANARRTSQYWKDEHLVANAEIDRLRAELAALQRTREWQPIETVPKDGTAFLCGYWAGSYWLTVKAHWANGVVDGGWDGAREYIDVAPTHWMPLPSPPQLTPAGEKPSTQPHIPLGKDVG